MKFLLHICCLSIAFAGCGAKQYENLPHDPIRLQAKADAESDASQDTNALTSFGAGVSVPFAAVSCGYMTASLIDVNEYASSSSSASYDYCLGIGVLVGSAGVSSLLIAHFSRPSNPPPERLIGKSPEYVKFYADAYRSKMGSNRMQHVAAGSIVGCASIAATVTLVFLSSSGGPD